MDPNTNPTDIYIKVINDNVVNQTYRVLLDILVLLENKVLVDNMDKLGIVVLLDILVLSENKEFKENQEFKEILDQ